MQVEQELELLFLNETIDPKLNIQVQYFHLVLWKWDDFTFRAGAAHGCGELDSTICVGNWTKGIVGT